MITHKNLSVQAPIVMPDQTRRGVPLEADDYVDCNLTNREPAPGSTITRCNTTIKEFDVVTSQEDIIIDGETIDTITERVYGKVDPGTLQYEDITPEDVE